MGDLRTVGANEAAPDPGLHVLPERRGKVLWWRRETGGSMSEAMSLQELAKRTGATLDLLEEWRTLGLIGSPGADDVSVNDEERVRLIQLFLRRGIDLDAIRAWVQGGHVEVYLERVQPAHRGRMLSFDEASALSGLEPELLRSVLDAMGGGEGSDVIAEEDIAALKNCREALDVGFPMEAMVQLVRVLTDAMDRIAEAETHLFHFYVRQRLQAEGIAGQQLVAAIQAINERTTPLIEPVLLYFHHRAFERSMREDMVLWLADETGLGARSAVPGQLTVAIVFVDLSSFTPLAEAMGDLKAAEVLDRFSSLVRDAVTRGQGRVVKQIGDAFMLVFGDARSAVACALDIEAKTSAEPQFPAVRGGIHWGPVLYREGDYVGANVIIASRLAVQADRHQVLLSDAARKEAGSLPGVDFVRQDRRRLKGLAGEIEVFEARSAAVGAEAKSIDPVCGMELGAAEVAANLALAGRQIAFCSEECLRRFVAAPDRYAPAV